LLADEALERTRILGQHHHLVNLVVPVESRRAPSDIAMSDKTAM
jgi:hypothetical protein